MDNSGTLDLTRRFYTDRSLTVLVLSNLLTIMLAVFQQWDDAIRGGFFVTE